MNAFFCESATEDQLNFRQFMKVLAHFRPVKKDKENKLNSREGKLRFAFKMYDTDNDELISKDELLGVLQMMVGDNIRYLSISIARKVNKLKKILFVQK